MIDEGQKTVEQIKNHDTSPKANAQNLKNPYGTTGINPMDEHEINGSADKKTSTFRKQQDEEFGQKYDTQKLYMGIQRHWLLILISMVIWAVLGWWGMSYLTSQYKAEAVVLYQGKQKNDKLASGTSLVEISMATAMDMIKQSQNFEAVRSILGLDISSKQLSNMTRVPTPKNDSDLISIIVKSDNPNLAVDIANTLAKISVKQGKNLYRKQLYSALENYKGELLQMQEKLSKEVHEIEIFKQENRYFEMTAEHSQMLDEVTESRNKLQNTILRYNSLLVEYENLKREAASLPEQLTIGSIAGSVGNGYIRQRMSSLEVALSEARAKYHPNNPKIKLLKEELKQLRERAVSEKDDPYSDTFQRFERNQLKDKLGVELMRMQGKVRSAQKMKQDMQRQVEGLEGQLENLPAMQMTFSKLLSAKELTEDQIKFLNEAIQETQLMINVPRGSVELYHLAEEAKPLKDSWWVDILPILTTIFGFFFGIGLALLWETQDSRLCTANQLDLYYSIPCLVEMPELRFFSDKNAEEGMLFFIRNLTERAERLYGKQSDANKATSITLTGSADNEGKSCFSYYLARYFHKLGKKTILLEMDYNKNPFTEKLPSSGKGLQWYLKGKAEITEVIQPGIPDRLKLSGRVPEMKELLKSDQMKELWDTLQSNYDMVIIDAPGIIKEDYAVNLASYSDVTLFVIGSTVSNKKQVDDSLKELEHIGVKPHGFILNRIQPIYIDDERIKRETKKYRKRFFQSLFTWKK